MVSKLFITCFIILQCIFEHLINGFGFIFHPVASPHLKHMIFLN